MAYYIKFECGHVWGPVAPDNPASDYDDPKVGQKVSRWVAQENSCEGRKVCQMVVRDPT